MLSNLFNLLASNYYCVEFYTLIYNSQEFLIAALH